MPKPNVEKTTNGFIVSKSEKQLEKEAREQRKKERKEKPVKNPTNEQIYQVLLDIQEEIDEIRQLEIK